MRCRSRGPRPFKRTKRIVATRRRRSRRSTACAGCSRSSSGWCLSEGKMQMNAIDLKDHVRRAVASSWDEFAREHPLLSLAIDQDLLVEQAMTCIADDPKYRPAMEQAAAVGI